MQNAFVESFNGRLRVECLNEHVFTTLAEARWIVEAWRIDYNTVRPHGRFGRVASGSIRAIPHHGGDRRQGSGDTDDCEEALRPRSEACRLAMASAFEARQSRPKIVVLSSANWIGREFSLDLRLWSA